MVSSSTKLKNVYWCENNVYSGWTSLYFQPDSSMHMRIKYTGVGNWQYTGDGTWYILNKWRKSILSFFEKAGYRIKEISPGEAAGRQKVHNAKKGTQRDYYEERRHQQRVDEERRNVEEERRRERGRRQRETSDAFNDFFNNYSNNFSSEAKTQVKADYKEIENAWLTIFNSLEVENAKKLYKQVAIVLHPDRQGDEEAMKALNTAWQKVEKGR